MIQLVGAVLAATFAILCALIGLGFTISSVQTRDLALLGPAAIMFGAGFNAGYHYATPLAWIIALQVIVVGAFLITMRQWQVELDNRM